MSRKDIFSGTTTRTPTQQPPKQKLSSLFSPLFSVASLSSFSNPPPSHYLLIRIEAKCLLIETVSPSLRISFNNLTPHHRPSLFQEDSRNEMSKNKREQKGELLMTILYRRPVSATVSSSHIFLFPVLCGYHRPACREASSSHRLWVEILATRAPAIKHLRCLSNQSIYSCSSCESMSSSSLW